MVSQYTPTNQNVNWNKLTKSMKVPIKLVIILLKLLDVVDCGETIVNFAYTLQV